MRVFLICIIACIVTKTMTQDPVTMALVTAVGSNPEGFAKAAGSIGKDAVEIAGTIKNMIAGSAAGTATVINLTDSDSCTWYTYNQIAPIKQWTPYQSHLGPNAIVPLKSLGWGSMTTFCNNKGNPFQLERGGIYSWDGRSMKILLNWNKVRRRLVTIKKDQIGKSLHNGYSVIINRTNQKVRFYTYNSANPVKWNTLERNWLEPNGITTVSCYGLGSRGEVCTTYLNNKKPGFTTLKSRIYEWNGKGLSLVDESKTVRRRVRRRRLASVKPIVPRKLNSIGPKSNEILIINRTDKSVTFSTSNSLNPMGKWVNHKNFVGPFLRTMEECFGHGLCKTYVNNKEPAYTLERGHTYEWNGQSLNMVPRRRTLQNQN